MEENRKLLALALVVILGGNTGSIINTVNPKNYRPDPFTGLDGAKMKAGILEIFNANYIQQINEFEKIRQRLSNCEYKLSPPSTVFKDYINNVYSMDQNNEN